MKGEGATGEWSHRTKRSASAWRGETRRRSTSSCRAFRSERTVSPGPFSETPRTRDISQEAFIRLYETAGSFRGKSKFSTWFYRILVNLCLDHKRKHKWWTLWVRDADDDRSDTILDRQPAPVNDPVDTLSREEMLKALGSAVDRLAPRQRAAVLLRVQEDMATYDIARVLKCSEATVRVHLHRALATLKKTVEKH